MTRPVQLTNSKYADKARGMPSLSEKALSSIGNSSSTVCEALIKAKEMGLSNAIPFSI